MNYLLRHLCRHNKFYFIQKIIICIISSLDCLQTQDENCFFFKTLNSLRFACFSHKKLFFMPLLTEIT